MSHIWIKILFYPKVLKINVASSPILLYINTISKSDKYRIQLWHLEVLTAQESGDTADFLESWALRRFLWKGSDGWSSLPHSVSQQVRFYAVNHWGRLGPGTEDERTNIFFIIYFKENREHFEDKASDAAPTPAPDLHHQTAWWIVFICHLILHIPSELQMGVTMDTSALVHYCTYELKRERISFLFHQFIKLSHLIKALLKVSF